MAGAAAQARSRKSGLQRLSDALDRFKAAARESWANFTPLAAFTTPAAAYLVEFAGVTAGEAVLDVATGTGVVAVTAARAGARVKGIDLTPALLEEARKNAALIGASIEFREGDAEALPYRDGEFEVVLSQFGHMFAPRPHLVVKEMLRVLKPGGRIAFSTWPPHLFWGQYAGVVAKYVPAPPAEVSPPTEWGDPDTVRERLGDKVTDLVFSAGQIGFNALSPAHYRAYVEVTSVTAKRVVANLAGDEKRLDLFRAEVEAVAAKFFEYNRVRHDFLMTRAVKK